MKLRTRTLICVALVLAGCIVALGLALAGMQSAKNRFIAFVDTDQQVLQNTTMLYAQGLQTGQALRNIVLDPSDKQAVSNLDASVVAFNEVLNKNQALTAVVPGLADSLKPIAGLQEKRTLILTQTVTLAQKDPGAAANYLKENDTPTWREIRTALQKLIQEKTAQVEATKAQVIEFTDKMLFWSVVVALLAIALGVVIAFYLTRSIMRQLGAEPAEAVAVTHRIAGGDLAVVIDNEARYPGSLIQAISAMQKDLASIVTQVRASAESISTATREIAAGNEDLSSRTDEQASSLQETAASMEQLTSTVKQNSDNAAHANQLASTASTVATRGGDLVQEVVDMMNAMNQTATKVGEIIGVIDSIAFQTNILALNAAVEAARAGEQGRGFAVVASEVRALAQRSATAAKEIKTLIGESVQQAGAGASLAGDAGHTMQEIVESIKRVAAIVSEISMASHEQTTGIEQVNLAISQMDEVTQQNAALVEEAAAASVALKEQANELARIMAVFRLDSNEQHHQGRQGMVLQLAASE